MITGTSGSSVAKFAQQLQPVHLGHHDVAEHQVERVVAECVQRQAPIRAHRAAIALRFQQSRYDFADRFFVVHDQYFFGVQGHLRVFPLYKHRTPRPVRSVSCLATRCCNSQSAGVYTPIGHAHAKPSITSYIEGPATKVVAASLHTRLRCGPAKPDIL